MTCNTNTPKGMELKELIARIVDPVSFAKVDGGGDWPDAAWRCDRARDKAAHIMSLLPQASPAAGPVGEVAALRVAEAEEAHWIKEARKHHRAGRRSDHENSDLERARIARRIADKIAALVSPAPVEGEGGSFQASQAQPSTPGGEVEALALQCATEAAAKLWGGAALTPFPTEIEAARIALNKRADPIEWAGVAEEALGVMKVAADVAAKAAADEIYGRLLATTQDYLEENLRFNIASTLATAERERAAARERVALLRALLTEAVWFVADHQEAQPNDHARGLLDRIDAALKGGSQ